MECFGDFVGLDNFNNFIIFIRLVAYCVVNNYIGINMIKIGFASPGVQP